MPSRESRLLLQTMGRRSQKGSRTGIGRRTYDEFPERRKIRFLIWNSGECAGAVGIGLNHNFVTIAQHGQSEEITFARRTSPARWR